MNNLLLKWTSILLILSLTASNAFAQHTLFRTLTVDPTGSADFPTIQSAINSVRIGTNPSVRFTVLIYAGTYAENVLLPGNKENVDLVGIDRHSVIIAPASGDGIVITSGNEASRNNAIRNLTILTTTLNGGHGIKIVKGTAIPKDIQIEGVTIRASGSGFNGILGTVADTVRIFDCDIDAEDHAGILVGNNFEIVDSSVSSEGSGATAGAAVSSSLSGKDGLRLRNCNLNGTTTGLQMNGTPENMDVYGCEIRGVKLGVNLFNGDNVRFEACHIVAQGESGDGANSVGVFVDNIAVVGDILFLACQIKAIEPETDKAIGVQSNGDQGGPGKLRFVDCVISAVCTNTTSGGAWGVGDIGYVTVIGGSIVTSAAAAKETEVWDVIDGTPGTVVISGTDFSKWKGPIKAAGRPRSITQRTISAAAESNTVIRVIDLQTGSQTISTGITNPDVYRVLSVTRNNADVTGNVFIAGTDWAGNNIVEKITISGTTTKGFKPFKTVHTIDVPGHSQTGRTISIGTTNILGLYYPLSATGDILQQGRKASAATAYTLETIGTVNDVYATVNMTGGLTAGDSFEWAILTGQ